LVGLNVSIFRFRGTKRSKGSSNLMVIIGIGQKTRILFYDVFIIIS